MNCSRFSFWKGILICSCFSATAEVLPPSSSVRFQLRDPHLVTYRAEAAASANTNAQWLKAWRDDAPAQAVELGSRVVLQVKSADDIPAILRTSALQLSRVAAANVFILQAPEAWTALREAQRLAQLPQIVTSRPVLRRPLKKHGPYAPMPNDTYYYVHWNLEHRDSNGALLGLDFNARAAWPVTRGAGVVLAVGDDGVELTHPEFVARGTNSLHFNFGTGTTNAMPSDVNDNHSTAVAGLALAEGNNRRGMSGVAPAAQLASWKIFLGDSLSVTDEQLMDMFQYRSNVVSVQNHSWGNSDFPQLGPTSLESIGIANAIALGRQGRGIVMARSAGNGRENSMNANDDGYANDPRVIAVASVRADGRAASYSNPGACLLVAAPGGDNDAAIFMTDRQGSSAGYNRGNYPDDFADYVFDPAIFGTSFAAPQIAGVVALILSANTNLTYRDVQQILIHSSRHFDLADPDVKANGAGFRASHNVGFGIPDAGQAVALARSWINRPALTTVSLTNTTPSAIPENAMRVRASGLGLAPNLTNIAAWSAARGPQADAPTATLPLVYVGLATNTISQDLTAKAALIQRGPTTFETFEEKIQRAAEAGASFAVIFNDTGGTALVRMDVSEYTPIPAVFIDQNDGEALRNRLQLSLETQAQLFLEAARYTFAVTNTLLCEHVGVTVTANHPARGDLRITLISPHGTVSVLQHDNLDSSSGPNNWTYYSTLNFYESSAGIWTVQISDEVTADLGTAQLVKLEIRGVAITDSDADGLDDGWETARFGSLAFGPKDDPDADGYSNMREQIMRTDPNVVDVAFQLDLSPWDERLARLSWPGLTNRNYDVLAGTDVGAPLTLVTNLPGRFPETEWFTPRTNLAHQFFRIHTSTP